MQGDRGEQKLKKEGGFCSFLKIKVILGVFFEWCFRTDDKSGRLELYPPFFKHVYAVLKDCGFLWDNKQRNQNRK